MHSPLEGDYSGQQGEEPLVHPDENIQTNIFYS